jgi:hypothetical protein
MNDIGTYFGKILPLFEAAHGGRIGHWRERHQWINSPEGQAILAANDIEWWAKTEEEIAEEDAIEEQRQRTDPQCVLINTTASVIALSESYKREALSQAIEQWQQSIGGESKFIEWLKTGRNAMDLLLTLILEIEGACSPDEPTPTTQHNPFRLVP